jgi:hypothetical protein
MEDNLNDPKDTEGALLRRVRALLNDTATPALDIYKATGVAPNQQWSIRTGKTKAPSVNAIEALYVFLAGKPLGL